MGNEIALIPIHDICIMANAIATSKLFGMKTKEEALALMLVAQSEGLHPARAAMEYNIIQGRPSLKADAMLSRFQNAGGRVEWHKYDDECCDATLSHPQGGSVRIKWDMERVKKAQIKNSDMYSKYPRNMLRARVISEGIRAVFPGISVGMYTPEEIDAFEPASKEPMQIDCTAQEVVAPALPATQAVAKTQGKVERDAANDLITKCKAYGEAVDLAHTSEELMKHIGDNAAFMGELYKTEPAYHKRLSDKLEAKRAALKLTEGKQ